MGLNYAGFFDPTSGTQGTAVGSFFGTTVSWLFIIINGHLLLIMALVQSFNAFPVGPEPFAFLRALQPQVWGAEVFKAGPVDRAADDHDAAVREPGAGRDLTRVSADEHLRHWLPDHAGVGLLGVLLTLPMMQAPFTMALEQMLAYFQ